MSSENITRKIAVIFATDVIGYSTSMEKDEVQTLMNLRACKKILEDLFLQHEGRIFNTAGDSVLAEFSSAVSALVCAVEFQNLIKERNQIVKLKEKMEFRIGINIGDVVQEKSNLYGDGVNIAARLEALAKPNGICLSKNVYELVKSKTNFSFDDLGEQKIKNTIVHAFDINLGDKSVKLKRKGQKRFKIIAPFFSLILVIILILVGYNLWSNNHITDDHGRSKIIAVMPFINSAGETSQDYFFDGLTEDLIIDLSKIEAFSVISRNSVFNYKNKEYLDKEVAKVLNADYLLKGNARLRGDLIRLSIELVNGRTGRNIWADRFEQPKQKIFSLQDSLVIKIVNELSVKLSEKEEKKIINSKTPNLKAYDLYKRGLASQNRKEAQDYYMQAIKVDPTFGRAYGSMAISLALSISDGRREGATSNAELEVLKNEAKSYAQMAIEFSPEEAHSYFSLALIYGQYGDIEKSNEQISKALELEPENLLALQMKATNLINTGNFDQGLITFKTVKKIDPLFPIFVLLGESRAYLSLSKYKKAFELSNKALERDPNSASAMLNYITAAWKLGKKDDAKWKMEELLLLSNGFGSEKADFSSIINSFPWHNSIKKVMIETFNEMKAN